MGSIKITVDRLQPGLHVRLPLKWHQHPFLFNSFKISDQQEVDIIRHLGAKYVYLNPSQSDVEPLPVLMDFNPDNLNTSYLVQAIEQLQQVKDKQIKRLNDYVRSLSACEQEFERSLSRMRNVVAKLKQRPASVVDEANTIADDIVTDLLEKDNVTLHLMGEPKGLDDTYFHSLNVAVLSMMIGKARGYDRKKLKELCFAALSHDIGKVKIPQAILRKTSKLTEPEEHYFQQHTKYGVEYADKIDRFPESAKRVIAQHHERNDGSGYPNGLKQDEIDELTQIIMVADAYDNLCHPKHSEEQKIPYQALAYLYKHCRHLYNQEFLEVLVKLLGVYPPGTIVRLSNDTIGMVISVNQHETLKPNVLVYDPSIPRNNAPIIDLSNSGFSIVKAIVPNRLPQEVREYLSPRTRISYYFESETP